MTATIHMRFKNLEQVFHTSLTLSDLSLLASHALTPHDLLLHGEFAFLLLGLKPCMLISFPSTALTARFRDEVLRPAIEGVEGIRCATVAHDLNSPEMRYEGAVLCMNERHERLGEALGVFLDETVRWVEEAAVGRCLDYPGSLPGTEEEVRRMVEVGYVDYANPDVPVLLTTYAALEDEIPAVKRHFATYRSAALTLGVDLKLSLSRAS
ncbi:hypothetical protein BC938DRAFT_474276 [Jimgerdemannia flammicorona]|uniref:Uncharacterized protein n=1 Tax=Jimgerdemannia flammicorona TaxID=994334 RepID=A0A433QZM8_9FUNG|nr:hypothetical protein BC938DRAFT_474276 [Jimgerdemannia flammicorona]